MSSLQRETLRMFTALSLLDVAWPGKLVFSSGFDDAGMALAMAVVGVGGACLTVEADATAARKAGQAGASDFTVAVLSEALRILKNEIRKGSSISVGLHGEPHTLMEQMLQRGVQPDFVGVPTAAEPTVCLDGFVARGSGRIALSGSLSASFTPVRSQGWRLAEDAAANLAERRVQDRAVAETMDGIETEDGKDQVGKAMQRWMRVAPRLFPRDLSRIYFRKELR